MKWTKEEIDLYKQRCINHFNGIGGNKPIQRFLQENEGISYYYPNDEERFALSDNSLSFGAEFVKPDTEYRIISPTKGIPYAALPNVDINDNHFIFPGEKIAPILGIDIISQINEDKFFIPLESLISPIKCSKGYVYPHGDVNNHLLTIIRDSRPYVTVRELYEALLDYIGSKEFYFVRDLEYYGLHESCYENCYLVDIKKR